jgi:hypothetical protein
MPKPPSTSGPRPAWVLAVVGLLLVCVAFVLWDQLGGAGDEPLGRTDEDVVSEGGAALLSGVELAGERVVGEAAQGDERAAADPVRTERSAFESEVVLESSPPARMLDEPAPLAFIDTPVERVPVGDSVVLDLVVRAPKQIGSPRLPAWLDLERGGAKPDVRRVLGDIEGDLWTFVVGGLQPGRHRWTVRTGIHAPIAGDARLEVGRNEVRYELRDFDASTVVVTAEFPWGTADDGEASGDGSGESREDGAAFTFHPAFGNDPHAPTTFGPSSPWVVFDGATPDDTVLVPLAGWFDAWSGVVPQQGPFESRTNVFGALLGGVRPRLLGGMPLTHAAVVEQEFGGATVEVRERDERAERVTIELKVRWPKEVDTGAAVDVSAASDEAPPTAVTAVLYGAVPEELGALDRPDGPSMWRAVQVPLPLLSEMLHTGSLSLDPCTTPRGARVAFLSLGMQPIFHDLGALLETQKVLLEFEPGSGGVLVAAYQNHRFPGAHWAPGFGFDVARMGGDAPDHGDPWNDPLADVRRTGPMGWIEYAFDEHQSFDAASFVVRRPDANLERTGRPVHSKLSMVLRDAAPGVVELFVQD